MDPVTHGIAGALLGKAFFSKRQERVAIFAATLGAVFPDVDIFAEAFSRDPLSIIKYHRAITHSFVGLPFFAFLLAVLTRALLPWTRRRWPRFRDLESPSLGMLTLIYGVGIASHILLDAMTSFGTRIWFPISSRRVAWDLLFIIDFSFTAIILVPQVLAWIYRDQGKSRARAMRMWVLFTVGDALAWLLTRAAGYPFHLWVAALVSVVLAALFFAPARGGWGFRITRATWCQAGAFAALVYLFSCSVAHHVAILRAKAYADQQHLDITRIGALPIPPSWLDWGDAIRSADGLYESQFDLRAPGPPAFRFTPDSPPDLYIAGAFQLPNVRLYWTFARFPSINSFVDSNSGDHVVELGENRFQDGRRRGPQPFTYEVVFDRSGSLLEEGWLTNGMLQSRMRRMVPQQPAPASPAPPTKKSP
jgi:membrane-bound metal-dependent hydrolase YbcI (DUF457 family)